MSARTTRRGFLAGLLASSALVSAPRVVRSVPVIADPPPVLWDLPPAHINCRCIVHEDFKWIMYEISRMQIPGDILTREPVRSESEKSATLHRDMKITMRRIEGGLRWVE